MLEISWEWLGLSGLLLLLVGYAVYQRRCWLGDDDSDEEGKHER
ncbi:MAG TPA: hypothetical protein VHU19_05630 [Pyrinomonadaceae bacterium]|jgi:hypothetical protein|nr:hypothetical protein [Pyrinomonadaceae bacterium]